MQLPQTLTLEVAAAALEVLKAQPSATAGEAFTIDASALQVFDTAALAVLLQARRLAQSRGQAWRVLGAPPKLAQLAQLYGVAELLGLASAA
jgi:phospholipid transport system transporter-binding protein